MGTSGAEIAVGGSCSTGIETEALRLGRGIGIAVSGFVVVGADSREAEGATGITAGCSSAGEADGGGIDSVTSRS